MSDTDEQRKLYHDRNLQVVFGVTLMAVLGVSSVTPAFPTVQRELGVSSQDTGLLITVFTLPGVFLTPVAGILADRVGRKRILFPSLLLFGMAGGACAFAKQFDVLLLLRFLQGVGAASLGALNVTIIGDLFSGNARTSAMGYNSSVLSVGTAGYPAVGGALAALGWNYPFILPVIAVPIAFLVLHTLKSPEPSNTQNLRQYLGNAWQSVKSRQVMGLFVASIATFVILYGSYLTYFPFLLNDSFNASSLTIGLLMSAMSLSTALTSAKLGRLAEIFSEGTLVKIGCILYAVSLVLIPFAPNLWALLVPTFIFGAAQGMNIPSIMTLLAGMAPMKYRAAFMSLNGMVLRIGQTLGPVIIAGVFSIWGMYATFFAGAVIAIGMLVVVAFTLK